MRHSLRNKSEVAHYWAHKLSSWGRCKASLHFNGSVIYSYQTAIGEVVQNAEGKRLFVLSGDSYSITTSAHQSIVRRAVPHDASIVTAYHVHMGATTICGCLPRNWAEEQAGILTTKAIEATAKAQRARLEWSKGAHMGDALRLIEDAGTLAQFFGFTYNRPENIEELAQGYLAEIKQAKQKAKELRDKRLADDAAKVELWRRGETDYCPSCGQEFLRRKGAVVETSQRVVVKVSEAREAINRIRSALAFGDMRPNITVGQWRVANLTKEFVYIGCHKIAWAEIDRLETALAN